MIGLLDEYIDVKMKDWVEVVCTYNTQRLTASAPRYRKHVAGAGVNLRRMLRGVRNLDTHGDGGEHDDLMLGSTPLGSEKGGDKPPKCNTPEKETCADMCALNCSGASGAVAVCQGECRLRCCMSTALSGGGPDAGEDEDADGNDGDAYDPWSMGLLCEDGSPPAKDDAADTVGKCPTNEPTSPPTAAPIPEDGDVCITDDELTCHDLCRLTCDASTEPSECSGQCTNVCCTLNGDFDPWSDSIGILCPDGSPAPTDGTCPKLTPTLQPTPMLDDDCDTADETTCRDMCLDACAPETTTEECLDDCSNA